MGGTVQRKEETIEDLMERWRKISLAFEQQKSLDSMSDKDLEETRDYLGSAPEYIAYQQEPVTIDTLKSVLEDFDVQAKEAAADPDAARLIPGMRKKLASDLFGIEDKINRYVAVLKKSEKEKFKFVRGEMDVDRDTKEAIADSVRVRNQAHDALIDELKSLHGFFLRDTSLDDEELGKGKALGLASIGIKIPEEKMLPIDMLDKSRDKRDAVERWATTNYFGSRAAAVLKQIDDRQEKLKKAG